MREWTAPPLPPRWTTSGQPPFVARREQLDAIEAAWADSVAGSGRAVFISGEPGAGKSRLVAQACTRLHATGAVVLFGACIQELGAAFEPFDQAVRQLLTAFNGAPAEPATAEALGLLESLRRTTDAAAPPAFGQERLYEAVIELLRAAARKNPLILVLDDLHWAGATALSLLARVVKDTTSSRLLLLGTLRNTPPERSAPLADTIAALNSTGGVLRMQLEPFTAEEITDYVCLRAEMTRAEAEQLAPVLHDLTGGNPFLLRETWRSVTESPALGGVRVIEMPDTISDVLRARIATLDAPERGVLELAAVLGQEVDLAELIAISESPETVTLATVDRAVEAGLLEPPHVGGDPYRFPHAIARQVIIDLLPTTRVLRLHARIAKTLEEGFATAPRLVQRLAHHYAAARALGFGQQAITYLVRSAEHAARRLAHEDAARLFTRASDITGDADERDGLRLRAAASWTAAADFARAREEFERVFDLGSDRLRLKAAIGYEDASWRPGLVGHRAVEMLASSLPSAGEEEPDALAIEALAALGRAKAYTGKVAEGELLCERALAHARVLDDPQLLAAVLRSSVSLTLRPHGLSERLERSVELRRLTRPRVDECFGAGAVFAASGCYIVGDRAGLDQAEHDLVRMAGQWGSYWRYWAECARFGRSFTEGRLADALVDLQRTQKAETSFRSDAAPGAHAVQSYMLRRETGQVEAVRHLITGRESPSSLWAPGLLALYTELELEQPARRVLAWLLNRENTADHDSSDWPGRLALMLECALWLQDKPNAARMRPWLQEYAGLNLMSGYFVGIFGSADRYLGQLESLCGGGDPMAYFESALDLAERSGALLDEAQTLTAMAAQLWQSSPSSQRAEALAARARSIAEPGGMIRVLRTLDAATAAETERAHAASTALPDGISPRELEVIRLLAEGRSNREIASYLVISEHTAANHVRSILMKIGAGNRTQAAMYARRMGLL